MAMRSLCGFAFAVVVSGDLVLLQRRAELVESQNVVERRLASSSIGNTVPLSEKGYQTVAALKDDDEMKAFVHRLVANEARYVKDPGELSGMVPFYSGTQAVQSLEVLKKELRSAEWVASGEGRNAPLSEVGYQNVAKLQSRPHMTAFARRILDAAQKVTEDEGSFMGMIPYFDGEVAVQSFAQLQHELLSAPWAVARGNEHVAPQPSQEISPPQTDTAGEDPISHSSEAATESVASGIEEAMVAQENETEGVALLRSDEADGSAEVQHVDEEDAVEMANLSDANAVDGSDAEQSIEEEDAVETTNLSDANAVVGEVEFAQTSTAKVGWNPFGWLSNKLHGATVDTDATKHSVADGKGKDHVKATHVANATGNSTAANSSDDAEHQNKKTDKAAHAKKGKNDSDDTHKTKAK